MNQLRPTLWRTCRVISCETRLRLLWVLFQQGELCVSDLANAVGMGEAQASIQLRALNARGLISSRREKMRVYYRAEANEAVDYAPRLLESLYACCKYRMAFDSIIHQATAFTHERRIETVRALNSKSMDRNGLQEATGMSDKSLFLHLGKLEKRGFINKHGKRYCLARPKNQFGAQLLQLALT